MKTVPATEAKRHVSKLPRELGAGERVIVTSRGQPVAMIQPVPKQAQVSRGEAWARLRARLDAQPVLGLSRFDRDALDDD